MAEQTPDSGMRRIWGNLSPGQRLMVGGTVVAVLVAVVVAGVVVSRAGYSVLYSGLAPEEAPGGRGRDDHGAHVQGSLGKDRTGY
jgi:flagellar biosynthesis/type III secretory pathway M-ring protein FliF/YscJ